MVYSLCLKIFYQKYFLSHESPNTQQYEHPEDISSTSRIRKIKKIYQYRQLCLDRGYGLLLNRLFPPGIPWGLNGCCDIIPPYGSSCKQIKSDLYSSNYIILIMTHNDNMCGYRGLSSMVINSSDQLVLIIDAQTENESTT